MGDGVYGAARVPWVCRVRPGRGPGSRVPARTCESPQPPLVLSFVSGKEACIVHNNIILSGCCDCCRGLYAKCLLSQLACPIHFSTWFSPNIQDFRALTVIWGRLGNINEMTKAQILGMARTTNSYIKADPNMLTRIFEAREGALCATWKTQQQQKQHNKNL